MTTAESSWPDKWRRWLATHPYTASGATAFAIVAVCFCLRQQSEWRDVFLPAAARLWRGEDMYRPENGYLYPPFMACAALPFLAPPEPLGRCAWMVVNLAGVYAMLLWSWRASGGQRLEGRNAPWSEHLSALLGCLCGVFYLNNCLAHQQTDIVIGAALAGGCLLLVHGKNFLAATAFGLAAACKCTGLLWAPYLVWRGRPWAALWLMVVAFGVNRLPDLVSRPPTGGTWLATYTSRFLSPIAASDHYVGSWGSDPAYNQSLAGLGQRWCLTSWTWSSHDCTIEARPPLLGPRGLRAGVYGPQLLLILTVLAICRRPFRPITNETSAGTQALECGIVLLLMLLLSPMSSKAHFGTLLVPGYCLARATFNSRSRLLGSLLLVAVLLGLLSNKDPLGERLYTLSLWYGVVTWQSLVLLAGCLLAIARENRKEPAHLSCPADGSATTNQAA